MRRQCVRIRPVHPDSSIPITLLHQVADARPYKGKLLVFNAALRVEDFPGNATAHLLIATHRADASASFRGDMANRPITSSDWAIWRIAVPVAPDARDVEIGIEFTGRGAVWIDNISIAVEDDPAPQLDAIRAVIRRFADSRNAHDGNSAAATYAENGEYIAVNGVRTRGRNDLTALWGGAAGEMKRTIESVILAAPNTAVARGTADFPNTPRLYETFILVRNAGKWKIQVHEASLYNTASPL